MTFISSHDDTLLLLLLLTGVARGGAGGAGAPPGRQKRFHRHFCWNESKMGLNLVRCTPADEIKKVVSDSILRIWPCKRG